MRCHRFRAIERVATCHRRVFSLIILGSPRVLAAVVALCSILPFPAVWQTPTNPCTILACLVEANVRDWFLRKLCPRNCTAIPAFQPVVGIFWPISGRLKVRGILCICDGIFVHVKWTNSQNLTMLPPRMLFPWVLHIHTITVSPLDLQALHNKFKVICPWHINHARWSSLCKTCLWDLDQPLRQILPVMVVARQRLLGELFHRCEKLYQRILGGNLGLQKAAIAACLHWERHLGSRVRNIWCCLELLTMIAIVVFFPTSNNQTHGEFHIVPVYDAPDSLFPMGQGKLARINTLLPHFTCVWLPMR
mmetsp:Transcript_14097/g.24808  ORF Transcript_14097/g.24808 Transcript_14097/m.24808 type:complete len:306 (+) Transcript_14097:678-1595(+)